MTGSLQVSGSSHYLLGNVGIGTTTPSEKLEVAGNAKVTGSLSVQNIQYASGDILTVSESGTITKINRDNAAELLGVNSKTLMQDLSFGESYINNYRSRVLDNTGTYFPTPAGYNFGVLKNKGYLEKAGVVLLPSGVKTGGLFSVKPKNGNGDFDFTRNSIATYVDEDGLIQVAEANVPRLDYPILNGVVQSCPALLLEPSRTNVLLRSEEFDIAAWQRAGCAATANQTTSPSGDLSADLIQENTSTGSHDIRQGATVVSGTIYTYSLFVKRYEGGAARNITFFIGGPNGAGTFNFDTESWESISGLDSFGFDKLNGGWYRLYFTDTAVSTSFNTIIILNNGTTTSYTGDNVSGLYLWGAQLELGSYATSYIPTSGSTVTRAVDSAYKTGISSLIGQTEGALFVECSALANDATNRRITISDGTSSNRIYLSYKNFSNQLRVEVISAGSSVFDFTYTIADITQTIKMAMTYKLNDFAFYVNGVQVAVDTSGAVPTSMSVFKFEDGAGGNVFFGKTKQLIAFNAALTDEQLEDLTSWDSFEELAASQFYTLY